MGEEVATRVLNQHSRRFDAPPESVGALMDGLSSRRDPLWPHERWPRMAFDGPLGEGVAGGHGPIRYSVEGYEPGRKVVFRFNGPPGFHGIHRFEVEPTAQGSELRHTIDMGLSGSARFSWPLVFGPLHDALLEDALDKAEAALSGSEWQPREFPWRVRFLRSLAARGRKGRRSGGRGGSRRA
jgi:hypothetical protein